MPKNADFAVALWLHGLARCLHCLIHPIILVILRDHLRILCRFAVAIRPINGKVAEDIHEPLFIENTFYQYLKLRHTLQVVIFTLNAFPYREAIPRAPYCSVARLHQVTYHEKLVVFEKLGDFIFICFKLEVRGTDSARLARRTFELKDRERDAVYIHHHIGAAHRICPLHSELIHDEEFVIVRILKIKKMCDLRFLVAVSLATRNPRSLGEQFVRLPISFFHVRVLNVRKLLYCLVFRFRNPWIDTDERALKTWQKHNIAEVLPLTSYLPGRQVWPEFIVIAKLLEPLNDWLFRKRIFVEFIGHKIK